MDELKRLKEEPKYTVNIDGLLILAKFGEKSQVISYDETIEHKEDYIKELTEEEIREYNPKFMVFAEPVMSSTNERIESSTINYLNEDEYKFLNKLNKDWKWIARDARFEQLCIFTSKPQKSTNIWDLEINESWSKVYSPLFKFIKSSDTEPYNIDELIKVYERKSEEVFSELN